MSAHRLTLWGDLACAGGEMLADIDMDDVLDGAAEIDLRHHGSLSFRAVEDAPWLADVETGRVIRLDTATGRISEWRISALEDGSGVDPAVRITCDPAALDLARRCGFLAHRTPGGLTRMAHGAVELLPRQYIATFLLPSLAHYGVTWIQLGEIESEKPIDLTFERWTPWQLMEALAEATGLEWDFRRVGETGYALDLVERIGADAEPVYLSTERNLLRLVRTRDAGDVASAVVMRGGAYGGDGERWGIEHATWRVAARSGNTLTLEAHNDGPGPIAFDGQLVGEFLQKPNGTRTPVLASTTAQTVTVQDASGVNVGDDVVFVDDAQGSLMYELRKPGPLTGVATFTDDDLRGERNYVSDPLFARWDATPDMQYAAIDAELDHPRYRFRGLRPGTVIAAGSAVIYGGQPPNYHTIRWVTAGGTVDGSGEVELTLNTGVVAISVPNLPVIIMANRSLPNRWQGNAIALPRPRAGLSVPAVVDGSHVESPTLSLRGLPPGMEVYFGDGIVGGEYYIGVSRGLALAPATVGPDGRVEIVLNRPVMALSDGDPVTLIRPALMAPGGEQAVYLWGPSPIVYPVRITHYAGMPTVWFTVGLSAYKLTTYFGSNLPLVAGDIRIEVRTAGGGAVLASAWNPDPVTVALGAVHDITLTTSLELTASRDLELWVYPVRAAHGQTDYATILRYAAIAAKPDDNESIQPFEGSRGTAIWQEGNRHLARISEPARVYECSVVDIATMAGFDDEWNELVLGGSLILRDPDRDISEIVRIVGMTINVKEPLDTQLTLDTRPDLETELFQRRAGQFVTIGSAAHPTTERPPARLKGAWRAVGGRGVSQPDVVPVTPYTGED